MKIKHQKLKSAGAFLTILLLLPYVVTVFVNGIDVLGMSQETCVQTETEDPDGEKTVRTVPWTEYMMGILGKTMPASYEKEALKAEGTGSSNSYHAVSAGCTGCCVQRGISDTGRIEEKMGS